MSWPVSSSCSHSSSTSGRWEKSQVCRVLNGLYFSSEANIYINHSQGLIQLLPMNCMELLHVYEWCQSCTQQLEILLQFYYITHQLRLYRVCLIQWQSCINCIHLSDPMRSADKLCISTPITSHHLFWFRKLRNYHGITWISF